MRNHFHRIVTIQEFLTPSTPANEESREIPTDWEKKKQRKKDNKELIDRVYVILSFEILSFYFYKLRLN